MVSKGQEEPVFVPVSYTTKASETYEIKLARIEPRQDDPSKSRIVVSIIVPQDGEKVGREETLVIEASLKPMINLVWVGTVTLLIGFFMTIIRRLGEARSTGSNEE